MLVEDVPPDGPRLPLLTELTLIDVRLTELRTLHLRNMLIERVEQGVPLEVLDLSTCVAAARSTQLLKEIVVNVHEARAAGWRTLREPTGFNWHGRIEYCNEVEYDDPCDDGDEDDDDDEDD
jgi:hypothetical protein